ncbi:MAG TPA: hypothetical protein VLT47_16010 [Anaeromyxobacteraceae bacterium]|nr:hypothetical protein [Anaeromyxobacteraceae bacterium]
MKSRILFAVALLLGAAPALATEAGDDVRYPDSPAVFQTGVDTTPIVTSDVTYEGVHAVVAKPAARLLISEELGGGLGAEAALPLKAPPARAARADTRVASCDCPCGHHG